VKDVAEAIFKAATTKNLHGKNYILSSESYQISDVTLMLNNQAPQGDPKIVYSHELAKMELGIRFKSAIVCLNQ
jgi:dihydroflavonol-4-reductase